MSPHSVVFLVNCRAICQLSKVLLSLEKLKS